MILNAILLALRQINRNYIRAFLTMLGIIIGVASVIIIINLGNGVQNMIKSAIESLGSNNLMVNAPLYSSSDGERKRLYYTVLDGELLSERVPGIRAVAPISSTSTTVKYLNKNVSTNVTGITNDYFTAVDWDVNSGRMFSFDEEAKGINSCIIGETVKKNLYKENEDPLGTRIKLKNILCTVVGVLESKGQGGRGNDLDDVVLIPIKSFLKNLQPWWMSINGIYMLIINLEDDVDYKIATTKIQKAIRDIKNIRESSGYTIYIQSTKEIQETVDKTIGTLTMFISAIAGVSLIVGGIGIMNIMLVSVTERTREIGTRLAIGALEKEVLLQFLIESATISAIGGLIGIILGFFMTLFLATQFNVPFLFNINVAIASFAFSGILGIIFGYLPAKKASRLNPIDALRHE